MLGAQPPPVMLPSPTRPSTTTDSALPPLAATSASYHSCGPPGEPLPPFSLLSSLSDTNTTTSRASLRRKPSSQPPAPFIAALTASVAANIGRLSVCASYWPTAAAQPNVAWMSGWLSSM
ncbi:hypothetical protein [Nannocystis pusilla]|uniref:hypothetical protein n=1 Tax=Nannocystis pusilla TaxID=889268 RepID=UPI003B7C7CCE